MTLIEAVKTGRKIRRKGHDAWLGVTQLSRVSLSPEEILADDWEVEPTSVTITREQFNKAWDKALTSADSNIKRHEIICRELGL